MYDDTIAYINTIVEKQVALCDSHWSNKHDMMCSYLWQQNFVHQSVYSTNHTYHWFAVFMNDTTRQDMKIVSNVSNYDSVTGVISTLSNEHTNR